MMKLCSIAANRHIVEGQAYGKPLRLLLKFDGGHALRLQVAEDGERLIIDQGPLEEPFDMGEFGRIEVSDVTHSLFPQLRDADVTEIQLLVGSGRQIGLKLNLAASPAFHLWVDGDELHWGDEAALIDHDWLDQAVPKPSVSLVPGK